MKPSIYNSLDILPYKTLLKILLTGDIRLLALDDDVSDIKLIDVWNELYQEYKEKYGGSSVKKVFRLSKEIGYFKNMHKAVVFSCECLLFDFNQKCFDLLKEYGYRLSEDNYIDDLNRIKKESESLLIRAENLESQLPKIDLEGKLSIDDVMASYSSILGFDFDYNTISVTKFFALEKSVKAKTQALVNSSKPKKR